MKKLTQRELGLIEELKGDRKAKADYVEYLKGQGFDVSGVEVVCYEGDFKPESNVDGRGFPIGGSFVMCRTVNEDLMPPFLFDGIVKMMMKQNSGFEDFQKKFIKNLNKKGWTKVLLKSEVNHEKEEIFLFIAKSIFKKHQKRQSKGKKNVLNYLERYEGLEFQEVRVNPKNGIVSIKYKYNG